MIVSTDPEARQLGEGSELTASSVLLMLPKHAKAPVAVLIDGDRVPSSVLLDIFDARETFVRLRHASVFGAPDVVVFLPRDASGRAYRRVRVPIPSLDRPSWHDYALTTETRTECMYRIADAAPPGLISHGESNVVRTS